MSSTQATLPQGNRQRGVGPGRTSGGSSSRNQSRGGRGGPARRGTNRQQNRNNSSNNSRGDVQTSYHSNGNDATERGGLKDEEILIAFMPYLKSNNAEAARIHEEYQSKNDQAAFLRAARAFLSHPESMTSNATTQNPFQIPSPALTPPRNTFYPTPEPPSGVHHVPSPGRPTPIGPPSANHVAARAPSNNPFGNPIGPPQSSTDSSIDTVEMNLRNLWGSPAGASAPLPIGLTDIWGAPPESAPPAPVHTMADTVKSNASSPWSTDSARLLAAQPPPPGLTLPPATIGIQPADAATTITPAVPSTPPPSPAPTPPKPSSSVSTPPPPTRTPKKEPPPPKRLWTNFEEQPGRIQVNNISGQDLSMVLTLGPREELFADWSLPRSYLAEKFPGLSLEESLRGLKVGLFRRGCTENGGQASIISKSVTGDDNRRSFPYHHDAAMIRGKVPFYSPRTPGHVIFRLYHDDDTLYTLAMGPSLHVRVSANNLDATLRFILSNFRGKIKSNPTSLSSLHSLSTVLESVSWANESAGRALWGCLQESRKVVEACWAEYCKTSNKLAQLEEVVEELKQKVEDEEDEKVEIRSYDNSHDVASNATNEDSETVLMLREKTKALMSGRASCERKWRDSQLAFASILKVVVSNASMSKLLRREFVAKMRIEFELWCPLSEEFAVLSDSKKIWSDSLKNLPVAVTAEDFRQHQQARVKMQMRTLSFEPNTMRLVDVLYPAVAGGGQRAMDPAATAGYNTSTRRMVLGSKLSVRICILTLAC